MPLVAVLRNAGLIKPQHGFRPVGTGLYVGR